MRAFAARLTAPGRGAVAVVRVWGPDALAVADSAFRPHRPPGLSGSPVGRSRVGRVGAGLGDEVVAVVLPGLPAEVEIQCHGGPEPVAMVVEALVSAGAAAASPEDWLGATAASPIAAAAWADLARAETVRVAEILLDQAQGALDAAIREMIDKASRENATALSLLDILIDRSAVGLRLIDGWRVSLAGRPNVGKSRLMNALAGYERAIVDPSPGTTRDVVTVRTALAGWPVELADTAGLREADDPIEAAGVAMARARHRADDLVLLVMDRSVEVSAADRALMSAYPDALIVANKVDLPTHWEDDPIGLATSAATGEGIEALVAAIASRLVPSLPTPGAAVPFRGDQVERLKRARGLLMMENPEGAIMALKGVVA